MIFAMCPQMPGGKSNIVGSAAKIAVSQARPATITSTPSASARRNGPMPIWPTMCDASSMSCSVSAGMPSMPDMRPSRTACFSSARGMSARITAMRKCSPSARAMSRIIASVASRCGAAPADPADPITSGTSTCRAPSSTLRRSRRVATGDVAISPLPR